MSSSPRVAITLSVGECSALADLARRRCEAPSTTAARLVRAGLAEDGAVLDLPPKRRRGPLASDDTSKVPWLPPSARRAAIDALKDRYPYELRETPTDLDADRLAAERLAALTVWRDELDAGFRPDPREELAFAAELSGVARWLEERGRRRLAGTARV